MPGFNIRINNGGGGLGCDDANTRDPYYLHGNYVNTTETARSQRFHFEIDVRENQIRSQMSGLYVKKISRPTLEIDRVTIHHGPDEIFRPGKVHYNPIDVTFYEHINVDEEGIVRNDSSAIVINKLIKEYVLTKNGRHYFDSRFYNANIKMLLGSGKPAWNYRLFRVWPTKISSSDLDYGSSEICESTMTLSYDHYTVLTEDRRQGAN